MDSHSNATCSTQKHRKMACAERKRKLTNAVYTIRQQRKATNISPFFLSPLEKKRDVTWQLQVASCSSNWSPIFAQANFAEAEMQSMIWLSSCALVFVFLYASAHSIIATWVRLKELHWLGREAMHRTVQWPNFKLIGNIKHTQCGS